MRLRPAPADSGGGHGADGVCKTEHRIITLHDPSKEHSSEFVFDRVFSADSPQEVVFNEVGKPLVEHAMQGYNACCFAYGQTSRCAASGRWHQSVSVWPLLLPMAPMARLA